MFYSSFYPGSSGIIPFLPIPTRYSLIFLITVTVLFYGVVNLIRRFYLQRYERDCNGVLHPVEVKPTISLLDGIFSLSRRWGLVKCRNIVQEYVFTGYAQAFLQCGHYWKKLGRGIVTIVYYPEKDKFKLLMTSDADVVLVDHELSRNIPLFREEDGGIMMSRWSAIDFASLQPRSETFCLVWTNAKMAAKFNKAFCRITQPEFHNYNESFYFDDGSTLCASTQTVEGCSKYQQISSCHGVSSCCCCHCHYPTSCKESLDQAPDANYYIRGTSMPCFKYRSAGDNRSSNIRNVKALRDSDLEVSNDSYSSDKDIKPQTISKHKSLKKHLSMQIPKIDREYSEKTSARKSEPLDRRSSLLNELKQRSESKAQMLENTVSTHASKINKPSFHEKRETSASQDTPVSADAPKQVTSSKTSERQN